MPHVVDDMNNNNQNKSTNTGNTSSQFQYDNRAEIEYLKSIDAALKELIRNSKTTSQSNARNNMSSRSDFRNPSGRRSGRYTGDIKSSFLDSFEQSLFEGVLGSDFKDKIKSAMNNMAGQVGLDLQDIPGELGKELGKQAISKFKETKLGSTITSGISKYANAAMNSITSNYKAGVDKYNSTHGPYDKSKSSFASTMKNEAKKAASTETTNLSGGSSLDQLLAHVAHIDAILDDKFYGDVDSAFKEDYFKETYGADNPFKKPDKGPDISDKAETISDAAENLDIDFGKDKLGDLLKNSKYGKSLSSIKDSITNSEAFGKISNLVKTKGRSILGKLGLSGGSAGAAAGAEGATVAAGGASSVAAAGGTAAASGAAAAGGTAAAGSAAGAAAAGLSSVAGAASMACPYILAAVAALIILDKLFDQFAPAVEGTKKLFESMKKSANRYQESRKKNLELAKNRLEEDTKSMIKAPFEILKEAAQKAYDVWDSQLRKINGTQGYNKSDLQNLMSSYATRLRDEGLSSVIGSTDVTENLSKVLDSGLSGKVAEEFAYIATKLNAAVPTQDFFGYASEYASVAANAIRQGKSEASAIQYANEQLELFASDVLYASRQISGGFSTGLKDAQSLFADAVKIAQAGKTGNAAQIAGVLTSVSAITGAIAPDLASSMTDAIVKAATGGNSSEIVALRSLAGINASNTEFLKQVSTNPQKVFATLFENLAKMQNMSNDAYMEVAEGLSNVFGVSMDAFARIDFNYLADAIKNMNVSNASLDENMKLLISGQTTTTAEQLRLQQINKYMIDEGLAYVLDNQVARSIQEHMWDEQMQREIMEAVYAVELQGSALEFLEGIRATVENLLNFLNPFALIKKLGNLAATAIEGKAQQADLRQLLELGKVGNGNATSLKQLTTRNANLDIVPSIVNLMGGTSLYEAASNGTRIWNAITNPLGTNTSFMNNLAGSIKAGIQKFFTSSSANNGINSKYSWGSVSKSTYAAISGGSLARGSSVGAVASAMQSSASSVSTSVKKLQEMLEDDYINGFVEAGKGYEDWAKSAKSKGISDLNAAIEDAGYTQEAVKGLFQQAQSKYGADKSLQRMEDENDFWKRGKEFWDKTLVYEDDVKNLIDLNNSWLEKLFKKSDEFYTAWVDYFVNHTAYNNAYKYSDVERIKRQGNAKESGDLVNALANALVESTVNLKDPQVQTNALLSQILIVAQAIMNQNNKVGGLSLPDSLNALALGLVKQT